MVVNGSRREDENQLIQVKYSPGFSRETESIYG
jgi:hypothetical protein